MVLGGSDPSLYEGQISYTDLIKPADFYRIPVDVSVRVNHACNGECSAVIDTGSPMIFGPPSKIEVICNAIGGQVSCNFII